MAAEIWRYFRIHNLICYNKSNLMMSTLFIQDNILSSL
jgi:hypothetical protein